ncbi:Crp/Fnr family transcriptional regulator [bacterium]|nr:MAG: Crp/Fnr family transcriptional regulator [bacterium]
MMTADLPKINPKFLQRLKEEGTVKHVPSDTVLLMEQSMIRVIPVLLSGTIRVSRTDAQGKELLIYYIRPGESCIMSVLGGLHHEKSKIRAVVEEEAELLLIPTEKANEWVKTYPEWTDYILSLYQKRFDELLNVVNSIAFQRLDDRLLALLKQKAELQKKNELNITHQQLADDLGSTREVVSRLLKQMENQGLVALARNKITLSN